MIEAYPLQWPVGYDRTKHPTRSKFKPVAFGRSRDQLIHEIKLLGGKLPVISTNIPLRLDGLPYASFSVPYDKGVAVYFMIDDQQMVLACDKWDRIEDNLHAIELTIEAMRSLDRWGVSDMLNRSFTGFKALPETRKRSCWEVLGIQATKDRNAINEAYRSKAKKAHSDMNNGSHEAFIELQNAVEEANNYANN